MKPKPPCVTIGPWLKANLGPKCLAGLTGTDFKALMAAVQIVELYSYERDKNILSAFGLVVLKMQHHTSMLAFHAIAHVMDWSDRVPIWEAAGLKVPEYISKCQFEPRSLT